MVGEDGYGETGVFVVHCWWECKTGWLLWKVVQIILKILKADLPHDHDFWD